VVDSFRRVLVAHIRCDESLSNPLSIDIMDVFFSSLSFATGAGRCGDVVGCIAGVNGRGKADCANSALQRVCN
jgi:hypothetical protein